VTKIFISYRREDSAGFAGRVHDRLEPAFGRDNLFMDVDAVPLGVNFIKVLRDAVGKCDVLLALIGPDWLDVRNDAGERRLDIPTDFVRIEIAAALTRGIRVVPVLLDGARMPRGEQLPGDLEELSLRNGLSVRHASFHADMGRLISGIRAGQTRGNGATSTTDGEIRLSETPNIRTDDRGTGSLGEQRDPAGGMRPSIGRELVYLVGGTVGGMIVGFFTVLGEGAIFPSIFSAASPREGGILIGVPTGIAFMAAAMRYWRLDLRRLPGWIAFPVIGWAMVQIGIWIGLTFATFVMEPPRWNIFNPGGYVGALIFGFVILWLFMARRRHRKSAYRHLDLVT
jgi:TIR domain